MKNELNALVYQPVEPFRMLTVCTGNICRSPMAERLFQAGLKEHLGDRLVVTSAGTRALTGNPIDPRVAGKIRDVGGDSQGFHARQLSPAVLSNQDLVLALSREHRSRIVEMEPRMLRKTFTLREFARLLPTLSPSPSISGVDRWKNAVSLAIRARSPSAGPPENDDVVDPYRQSYETYEEMYSQCIPAVTDIVRFMAAK